MTDDDKIPLIRLVINRSISDHVSEDTVKELEDVILSYQKVKPVDGTRIAMRLLGALAWRMYENIATKTDSSTCRFSPIPMTGKYFCVLMGPQFRKCMPFFNLSGRKYLYMFDAWPQYHDRIKSFVSLYNVSFLFVTSRQATGLLRERCQCPVYWIPEGIDPLCYRHYDYTHKDIDVLEFGRKNLRHHEVIRDFLIKNRKIHLYEKVKGELIFSTRDAFIDGLARAKISICFPSNTTHPERSGKIETMTIRFLQSIISKCVIMGHAPSEMVDLFGYNPVVEIDKKDPGNQLFHVLCHYEEFIPLVERNYQEVLKKHTWRKRWEEITKLIVNPGE